MGVFIRVLLRQLPYRCKQCGQSSAYTCESIEKGKCLWAQLGQINRIPLIVCLHCGAGLLLTYFRTIPVSREIVEEVREAWEKDFQTSWIEHVVEDHCFKGELAAGVKKELFPKI